LTRTVATLAAAIIAAVLVFLTGLLAGSWYYHHLGVSLATDAPEIPKELLSRQQIQPCEVGPCTSESILEFTVVPELSQASFFADVQLSRIGTAARIKGSTSEISGLFLLRQQGMWLSLAPNASIEVDVGSFTSEVPDRLVNIARILEADLYPTARFVVSSLDGLSPTLPTGQEQSLGVNGELTLHGVTRMVEWSVKARWQEGVISLLATTRVRYQDYNMPVPQVSRLITSDDTITLQAQIVAVLHSPRS
jgi:polyisoprenoid-binding protein YceI